MAADTAVHSAPTGAPPPTTGVQLGPRMPRREQWVELPAEYPEHKVKLWLNYPQRLREALDSEDEATVRDALRQIVLEHNGWLDFEGTPYPPASDPGFWDALSQELAGVILVMALMEPRRLPKDLAQRMKGR